jgi:chromosome partitioning protein
MRIITLINQKGGVGKTTTAVNLASALGREGKQVLLLDLDPQASATKWLGMDDEAPGMLEAFMDNHPLEPSIRETVAENVKMVPGSLALSGVERRLAGEVGTDFILRTLIKPLSNVEYLLIDCPPSLGLLTVNALTASREVLIPIVPHFLSLGGLEILLKTLEVVRERLNADLKIAGILPVRVDKRTKLTAEVIGILREQYPNEMLATQIRENIRLAEAPGKNKTIELHDARSPGAKDYAELAKELIAQE